MRKIDYWAGKLLCFILGLFSFARYRSATKPSSDAVQNILFVQISEIGSAVLADPAVRHAQANFPRAKVHYLIFEKNREIIEILGSVEKRNIITIRDTGILAFVRDCFCVVHKLRKTPIDLCIDLELFSRFSAIISHLSGAKTISGFHPFGAEGLYRGNLRTHKVSYNPYQHMGQNYFALVESLFRKKEIPGPKTILDMERVKIKRVYPARQEMENIIKKLVKKNRYFDPEKPVVVINPNAGELLPLRRWPIGHYICLIRRMLEEMDLNLVIIGLACEKPYAQTILDAVSHPDLTNIAGETTMKELLSLFNMAALLISNDSGPPNLASLVNTPAIVFFGPETPVLYRPMGENVRVFYSGFSCSPCVSAFNHRKSLCKDNKCLQAISPETVMEAVREMLGRKQD